MVNYTSCLPEDTFEQLNKLAKDMKVPKNEIINRALTNYIATIEINGLSVTSEILTFHIRTISKERLTKKLGTITEKES